MKKCWKKLNKHSISFKNDLNKLEEKLIEGYMNNEKATVDNV